MKSRNAYPGESFRLCRLRPGNRRRLSAILVAMLITLLVVFLVSRNRLDVEPAQTTREERQAPAHEEVPSDKPPSSESKDSFPAIQSASVWFKKQRHGRIWKPKGKGVTKVANDVGTKDGIKVKKQNQKSLGPLPKFWSSKLDSTAAEKTKAVKPLGVKKIMGLVFYGRRSTASILDCYLKRNLVKNGGVLDGVVWVQQTANLLDLVFLDTLIHSEPEYRRLYDESFSFFTSSPKKPGHATGYENIENGVMYIKIEDSIVFMEDTVIPNLIRTHSSADDISLVSANIVGASSASLTWVHWSLGAIKAYLPELANDFPIIQGRGVDWKASSLPSWTGPQDFNASTWEPPGNRAHRWLPVRQEEGVGDMEQTPIASSRQNMRGSLPLPKGVGHKEPLDRRNARVMTPSLSSSSSSFLSMSSTWQMAAQAHYSLLDALETNDLERYRFGLWDLHHSSNPMGGLHLVAMKGSDINNAKPIPLNDARHMLVTMPQKTNRRAVAAGEAVAAYYSSPDHKGYHRSQDGGLDSTDLLDRYRAFARENICVGGELLWSSVGDDPVGPGLGSLTIIS